MLMKAWFISFTVKKAYLNHVQQNSLSEKKSSYLQFISSIAFDTNSSSFHNYLHMLEEIPLKSFETPQKRIRFVLPITWFIWCWKGSNPGAAAFHAFSPIYFPFLHRHMLHRVRGDLLKLESDKWFRCGNVALSSLHISTYPFSSNPTKSPVPTDVGLLGKVEGGEMIDIGNDPPPNHFLVTEEVFLEGCFSKCSRFSFCRKKNPFAAHAALLGLLHNVYDTVLLCMRFFLGKVGGGGGPALRGVSEITMQHLLGK